MCGASDCALLVYVGCVLLLYLLWCVFYVFACPVLFSCAVRYAGLCFSLYIHICCNSLWCMVCLFVFDVVFVFVLLFVLCVLCFVVMCF